jgi:hypothetical protein
MNNYKRYSRIMTLSVTSFFVLSFDNPAHEQDEIYWSPDKVLSWRDFQGIPNYGCGYSAITSSGIEYDCQAKGDCFTITVRSEFFKKESWVKAIAMDSGGLKHEQGHFDIAEVYARKFRKAISETSFSSLNIKYKLKNLYTINTNAWGYEEELYDKETEHHKNRTKQYLWNERIASELKELKNYSSPSISDYLHY